VEDEILGALYALLRIIRAHAAGVRLTSIASCDPEVMGIRTVNSRLLICFTVVGD